MDNKVKVTCGFGEGAKTRLIECPVTHVIPDLTSPPPLTILKPAIKLMPYGSQGTISVEQPVTETQDCHPLEASGSLQLIFIDP